MSNKLTVLFVSLCALTLGLSWMKNFNNQNKIEAAGQYTVLKSKVPATDLESLSKAAELEIFDLKHATAHSIRQADRDALKGILLSDESYLFDSNKLSMFMPSVKVVFKNGNHGTLLISQHAKKVQFLDAKGHVIAMFDMRDAQFEKLEGIINKYSNNK
jgi:hypothetical protein